VISSHRFIFRLTKPKYDGNIFVKKITTQSVSEMEKIKSLYYHTSTTGHPVYGKRSILYNDGVAEDAYAFSIADYRKQPPEHKRVFFQKLASRALFRAITLIVFSVYFLGAKLVRILAR
jgi:hypothetical protein